MQKKIFINKIYNDIINKNISLFVGSGVSTTAGMPTWDGLLSEMYCALGIQQEQNDDFFVIAQYYSNEFGESNLKNLVNDSLMSVNKDSVLIDSLINLQFKTVWTTNFDDLFEYALNKNKIKFAKRSNDKDLVACDELYDVILYKLHGDLSNKSEITISKKDAENYHNNNILFNHFLKKELVSKNFLFLGYSFKDNVILNHLSSLKNYLGEYSPKHYYIIKKEVNSKTNEQEKRQKLFISDLKERYNINTLCVDDYNEIPQIINEINKKVQSKYVFISGVFHRLDADKDELAHELCKKLVLKLFSKNKRIISGYGGNLGNYIAGNATSYLTKNNLNIEDNLILRPFLSTMDQNEKYDHRLKMISQANCAIFIFGQSFKNNSSNGELEEVNSLGMEEEFRIALEQDKIIIPIGSTGYRAQEIWSEINENISQYPYLERYISYLNLPISDDFTIDNLTDIVLQIINDASC